MKAVVTNAYYTLNPLTVHLIGRWEDGRKMDYSFPSPIKPYFYYKDESGKIIKKEVEIPSDVKNLRDQYDETYEADIVFPERVLIDLGIRKGVEIFDPHLKDINANYSSADYRNIKLRKLYIDIETDERKKIDLEKPEGSILSIAMRDGWTNLTTIYTTIPKRKINTIKLIEMLMEENDAIRYSLTSRGLGYLADYVGYMDLKVESVENEVEMLEKYREYIYSSQSPDIQSGYNINGFDLPYLNARADKMYNIHLGYRFHRGTYGDWWASHNRITNIDLYYAYMKLQENDMKSFSLESVSQNELGIGKIQHEMGYHEMYEKDPEKFLVYNYRDALLCHLLDIKLHVNDFFLMLSEKTGTLDAGKWSATYLVDSLLLRETHGTDFKIPTARDHKKIDVKGGKVMNASVGVFKNVPVFDFKHLYPNIMVQFNISPDTLLLDEQITPNDTYIEEFGGHKVGYRKDIIGIVPKTIVKLVDERYKIKAEMKKYPQGSEMYNLLNNEQRAVKEADLSFYGVTGNEHARMYNTYNQASITYIARENLVFVADFMENLLQSEEGKNIVKNLLKREMKGNFKVLYGDTDSVFIWHPEWEMMKTEDVVEEAKLIGRLINSQFEDLIKKFNGSTDKIVLEMEFEKIYSAWEQWGGQKQYAGWMVWKDGKYLDTPLWDVKGFDPRRSDRSIYGSEYFMPKFLKLPLKSRMDALKFYEDEEKKWREHKIDPEIIGIYFSLNKEEYTTGTSGASSYMQKRAYDNAIKKGINLDRMKGKYRMYFLKEKKPEDVIAINYDDKVPGWIKAKIDWDYHRIRCMDVEVVKNIVADLRKNSIDAFEVYE